MNSMCHVLKTVNVLLPTPVRNNLSENYAECKLPTPNDCMMYCSIYITFSK